jgi:hypothetical protein
MKGPRRHPSREEMKARRFQPRMLCPVTSYGGGGDGGGGGGGSGGWNLDGICIFSFFLFWYLKYDFCGLNYK